MREISGDKSRLTLVLILLTATIFALDLNLPLGVAGGVPYVAIILLGWRFESQRSLILLGIVSSVLTIAGYYLSPQGGIHWMVLTNRALALFAIWVSVILILKARGSANALQIAHEELKLKTDAQHKIERSLKNRLADLKDAHRKLERQGEDLVQFAGYLQIARDEALIANKTQSDFLTNISHELRTPLNAIIGFSEIIKRGMFGPIGNARYLDYVRDIHGAGQHLLDLINDILDLSKIEARSEELHEEEFEIPEIVHSAVTLVKERARKSGVRLELDLPNDLPILYADKRKIKQILVNILSNAIKFTAADGSVKLKVWCWRGSGHTFQITDTGIGMALEDIPKALMPFTQIDSGLSRKYEGTGLGLPLTKHFVEMHGGFLDLQSEEGLGTTVTTRFPAQRVTHQRLLDRSS